MRILVIKNDGLGDLVLASGHIAALSRAGHEVDLVVCQASKELAELVPGVRNIITVSRHGLGVYALPFTGSRLLLGTPKDLRVLAELRRTQYDLAIVLRNYIRRNSFAVMQAVHASRKVCGWRIPTNLSSGQAALLTAAYGFEHVKVNAALVSELEFNSSLVRSVIPVDGEDSPVLGDAVGEVEPRGTLGLIIGGATNQFDKAYWVELIRRLPDAVQRVQLFAGKREVKLMRDISVACPDREVEWSQLGPGAFLSAVRQCSWIIGNDTGYTHVAASVHPRVMVLLGGGTYPRFFPWPKPYRKGRNQYILMKKMDCYGCGWNCKFPSRLCIEALTPEKVVAYLSEIIEGTAGETYDLSKK